jgi:hypothetical protein
MALAHWQVEEPALRIRGLTDVQQAAAADVDAVDDVVRHRRSAWCRADELLPEPVRELVAPVLPGGDVFGTVQRVG